MIVAYRHSSKWLTVVPVIAMLVFVIAPVSNIFSMAIRFDSLAILATPTTRNVVWFTTWQAVVSTVLVLLFAIPIAAVTTNFKFTGRKMLISLVTLPFILPTVVVGAAFLELLPSTMHRSAVAIIVAHCYFNVGLAVRIIASRWQQIHPQLDDAARTLGASTLQTFLTVTLPLLRKSLISAGLVVFLLCFTSYGVVRILGGPARSTIETEIYFRAMQLGDVSGALVLSVLQLVVVSSLVFVMAHFTRAKVNQQFTQTVLSRNQSPRTLSQRMFIATVALTSTVAVIAPLISVLRRSIVVSERVNFSAWQSIFSDSEILASLMTSFKYAIITIIFSTIIGLSIACAVNYGSPRYQFLNLLTALPVVISAVSIGLGIIVTFDVSPIDWRGAWLIMPIAHCLVAVPIVVRIVSPVLRDLPNGLRDASQTLGATNWQLWRTIDLQIITPALITAAAIACAISLGEFGASSLLIRRDNQTLPLTISRLMARPGDLLQAQAYAIATLMIVVCVAIIVAIDHLGKTERRI